MKPSDESFCRIDLVPENMFYFNYIDDQFISYIGSSLFSNPNSGIDLILVCLDLRSESSTSWVVIKCWAYISKRNHEYRTLMCFFSDWIMIHLNFEGWNIEGNNTVLRINDYDFLARDSSPYPPCASADYQGLFVCIVTQRNCMNKIYAMSS